MFRCNSNQKKITNGKKIYSKKLKTRIALDVIKVQKTVSELTSEYGVHSNQISSWKKQFLDVAPAAFTSGKNKYKVKKVVACDRLYQKFSQLKIEIDLLKKEATWDESIRESKMH